MQVSDGASGRRRAGRSRIVEGKREDQPGTCPARSPPVPTSAISLAVSPSAAISGDFKFTLTGPPRAAAHFAVPKVVLKRSEGVKQYVVLPNSADHRPVAWALQNLRRCDAKGPVPEDTVKYEVVGEPWQAVLLASAKDGRRDAGRPGRCRYAWQADGRCLGAAFLDVETAGAIDCPLELPAGFELLQLASMVCRWTQRRQPSASCAGEGTWTVPLASQTSIGPRGSALFRRVGNCPGPRPAGRGGIPSARRSWVICRSSARRGPSPRPPLRPAAVDAGRDLAPPSASGLVTAGDIAAQWQRFVAEGQATVSSAADGPVDAVALEYRPIEALSWVPRLTGIMTFLAAVGLAALLVRWGLLGRWFARRPYVFGVGFGLAWWLWLSPSAVGLLIVPAVLLGRFLPWRRFPRAAAVSPSDG